MERTQLPSYLDECNLQHPQDNDFASILDLDPFIAPGESKPSAASIPGQTGIVGRNQSLEQELIDLRNENQRLRQQTSTNHDLHTAGTLRMNRDNHSRMLGSPNISERQFPPLTEASSQASIPSIGSVLERANANTARTQTTEVPGASNQASRRAFSSIQHEPETSKDAFKRPKSNFSRPFRRMQNDSDISSQLNASSELSIGQDHSADQKRLEGLKADMKHIREQMDSVQRQTEGLQQRCSSLETRPENARADIERERDESFCQYFDWVFEFIIETIQLLEQQDLEIPAKLLNVYNNICKIGS